MSRPIGSEALHELSECDGYAMRKWRAAGDTLPQVAPGIMSFSVMAALSWGKSADPDRSRLELDRERHNAPHLVGNGAVTLRELDVFR